MKILASALCLALLAACSSSVAQVAPNAGTSPPKSGVPDGSQPHASLIVVNGTLYGTTRDGGQFNGGTVYSIAPSGTEQVLHSFGSGSDGKDPFGTLTEANGTLYGTTRLGGAAGFGTAFELGLHAPNLYGVIHSFGGEYCFNYKPGTDGCYPSANVIYANGTLYGATERGGPNAAGTFFSITDKKERVLHNFSNGDGVEPAGNVIQAGGLFYGVTTYGGANSQGLIYSMSTSGAEQVVHSLATADGQYPDGGLVEVGTKLYGTAHGGSQRNGTVFEFDRTVPGSFTVIHTFNGSDGSSPGGSLLAFDNLLYGTTSLGGASSPGLGTVFVVSSFGSERVLHSFDRGAGGTSPVAGLVELNGTLYGTTLVGGSNDRGTVYKITPSGDFSVLHNF
jgi:uncharacterized repeat protein (TIGR03803 family)